MRTVYILSILLLAFACSPVDELTDKPSGESSSEKAVAEEVLFVAKSEVLVKSSVTPTGKISWTMDDAIGVYDGTSYVRATVLGVEGNSITFSAPVDPTAASYVAINPYEAGLVEGGFGVDENGNVRMSCDEGFQDAGSQVVSVAVTTNLEKSFNFRNVVNLIGFYFPYDGVTRAILRGVNSEPLRGELVVDPSTANIISSEGLVGTEAVINLSKGYNFIAVPPGLEFESGFTVSFYTDDSCTDYYGEVLWENVLGDSRNVLYNLGMIDRSMFDNYQLWQHGKSFTIAGETYSKETTGMEGTLVKAPKGGEVDLKSVVYVNAGVFFLDDSFTGRVSMSTFINIGTRSSGERKVILISRYDAHRTKVYASSATTVCNFSLIDGHLICKGLCFDMSETDVTLCRTADKIRFQNLHFDDCKFIIYQGQNLLLWNNSDIQGVGSIKFMNSEFEAIFEEEGVRIELLHAIAQSSGEEPTLTWDAGDFQDIDLLLFQNNVFYHRSTSAGITLFALPTSPLPLREQNTEFKLIDNTFYNLPPLGTYMGAHSLASAEIRGNIFHTSVLTDYQNIVLFSKNETYEYPYQFENNLVVNMSRLYKFNPYQGVYNDNPQLMDYITDDVFVSSNPIAYKDFSVKAKYAAYGASVNCR